MGGEEAFAQGAGVQISGGGKTAMAVSQRRGPDRSKEVVGRAGAALRQVANQRHHPTSCLHGEGSPPPLGCRDLLLPPASKCDRHKFSKL